MKEIGIITFHSAHNYGAMLQVYALQSKLENSTILDYRNRDIDKNYKVIKIYKGKNILKFIKSVISNIYFYHRNKKRFKNFESFLKKHLKLTKEYKSEEELKQNPPLCDIYITGSDQVWNYEITNGLRDAYTLNFGSQDIKRISYAASIGNSDIKSNLKEEYKDKISKIDNISVREENAKKVLEEIGIKKEINVVLDPTLLLTKEEWNQKILNIPAEKEKYILAYVVETDEEYYKIVNYLSEKTGLKVIHFEKRGNKYKNVLRSAYTNGPFDFVNLIKNAEYVVATSFHATVFSIIFNKKFWIIPHKKTGSRVTNLLEKLEINNRITKSLNEFKDVDLDEKINYEKVEAILKEERKNSIRFLKDAINS